MVPSVTSSSSELADADEVPLDDLTVVIADWNLAEHTIRSATSLIDDGVPPERIVVVENGSTEENWAVVSHALPFCVLVRLSENVGFAAANNAGTGVLPGGAYLLVNNDAFLHRPGSVGALLSHLGGQVGIIVPRLLNSDGSLQPNVLPHTTPLPALVRASGLSRLVPNRWQPMVGTHWDHATSREIQAAVGAVMLVDGRLWTELDGFTEASFMYAEDIDLCWRARKRGWQTWFAGDAEFVHLSGSSSDRRWGSHERAERVGRAEAATIRANLSPPSAWLTLGFMRLGLAARLACWRLTRNSAAAESSRGALRGLGSSHEPVPGRTPEIEVRWPARAPAPRAQRGTEATD